MHSDANSSHLYVFFHCTFKCKFCGPLVGRTKILRVVKKGFKIFTIQGQYQKEDISYILCIVFFLSHIFISFFRFFLLMATKTCDCIFYRVLCNASHSKPAMI